jgi:GT2 family glycosyltransferase
MNLSAAVDRDKPKISVVIPIRNRHTLLRETLLYLVCKDSSSLNFEVLICDDGSTEDFQSMIKEVGRTFPYLRLVKQAPKGPAAARNLGVRKSASPIVLFLDSDVLPDRGLISRLVGALDKNSDWMGAEARIESDGVKKGPLWDSPVCQNGGRFHTAAIVYRRDALVRVGGFDESFKMPACEDVDLAAQVLKHGPIGFVPEAVAKHPCRRSTIKTHWRWRRFWKYEMFLAKRYGFLAFPGKDAGPFPRLRVALAAVVTQPGGRFIEGIRYMREDFFEGSLACFYGLFDVLCGTWALPSIFFSRVPERKNYL